MGQVREQVEEAQRRPAARSDREGPGGLPQALLGLAQAAGNKAMATSLAQTGSTPSVQREVDRSQLSETTDTGNTYTQTMALDQDNRTISVNLGVNWVKQGTWASDDAFWTFVRKVKTAAYSYLDNKFKVHCSPNASDAGTARAYDLPITFLIYDDPSGYRINAHGGNPGGGSAMSQSGGDVYENESTDKPEIPITYAHEFGHAILGASDEYANPAIPGRVLTNDHSIMANYYTQGIGEAAFKVRHFDHITKAVAAKLPGYTCTTVAM